VGAVASGEAAAPMALKSNATRFLAEPSSLVGFLLTLLILGPVPEELGWRGYAIERLQTRYSPLAAALILGFFWALWHTPLFFLRDMLHWRHGVGSAWFWMFMIQVPCMSVLISWLFNNTRHSTLAAILFHFSTNFAFALGNVTNRTNACATLLWVAAAVAVARRIGGPPARAKPDACSGDAQLNMF
jgi:membrane protease YdiL (CAAX protease family)